MNKIKSLRVLHETWQSCSACEIAQYRDGSPPVIGAGHVDADYLFIVDGPSQADVLEEVGPLHSRVNVPGARFRSVVENVGISADRVYYTSLVGCAPMSFIPASEKGEPEVRDRDPITDEINACRSRAERIIYTIDPRVVIICGDKSFKSLIPRAERNGKNTLASALEDTFRLPIPGVYGTVYYTAYAIPSPRDVDRSTEKDPNGALAVMVRRLTAISKYVEFAQSVERERDV